MEDDALQVRRIERIHRRGAQRRHRNADLHPCCGGEIARVLAERFGRGEAARECRDLESFARAGQYYARRIPGRARPRRADPEAEVPARELRRAKSSKNPAAGCWRRTRGDSMRSARAGCAQTTPSPAPTTRSTGA